MTKLFGILLVVATLSGCAVVDKARDYWPRDHDPALVSTYINLEILMENVSCDNRFTVVNTITTADWLNRYAVFRNDPQKVTTEAILSNLKKASESSEAACKRYVNLTNINMKILKESWSKR
jgi:hypothetical protein